jgi:hypothetical protein
VIPPHDPIPTPFRESPTARQLLQLSDRALLEQCAVDVYRASGPGGQKRNKTSSAVRLRHDPTGLIVIATESRSQHENRERALKRLRHAIALTQRSSIQDQPAPDFYVAAIERDATLRVNPRHPHFWLIVQYVLDVLDGCEMSVGDAAQRLGISTGQLIRFLKSDEHVWAQANHMRDERGLSRLR